VHGVSPPVQPCCCGPSDLQNPQPGLAILSSVRSTREPAKLLSHDSFYLPFGADHRLLFVDSGLGFSKDSTCPPIGRQPNSLFFGFLFWAAVVQGLRYPNGFGPCGPNFPFCFSYCLRFCYSLKCFFSVFFGPLSI